MESSPERRGDVIAHAGRVPSEYVVFRCNELLSDIIKNDADEVPLSKASSDIEIIDRITRGFDTRLNNFMELVDPRLNQEFQRMSHLVTVDERYPETIDGSDNLPLSQEGAAVLNGSKLAYYAAMMYLHEQTPIDPNPVAKPKKFFPAEARVIDRDSMRYRGLAVRTFGRKAYEDVADIWEPVLDTFHQAVGGPDMLELARVGVGYASYRVNDINHAQVAKHNKNTADKEGYLAAKILEDMSADEIMDKIISD